MARIRTIKPEFWTSEQIVECSTSARLLFIGMWNFVDDGGVMPASTRTLKMRVFPGDEDINSASVRRMIDELSSNGLIIEYEVENERFWHVTGWSKHQKIDRPSPKYPPPSDEGSTKARRGLDEGSPPEGKGRDSKKGRESKGVPSPSLRSVEGREPRRSLVEQKAEAAAKPVPGTAPNEPDDAKLYRRGKEVLGAKAGGQITKLKNLVGVEETLGVIELAAGKQDPPEYLAGVLRAKQANSGEHVYTAPPGTGLPPDLEAKRRELKGLDG